MRASTRRRAPEKTWAWCRTISSVTRTRVFASLVGSLVLATIPWGVGHAQSLPSQASRGDIEDRDATEPAIKFQRFYAPRDQFLNWPTGDLSYFPVERSVLDAMIARINAAASAETRSLAASIVSASYEATLREDRLLTGIATLEIRHAGDDPAMLDLVPCGVSIRDARWIHPTPRGAVLGRTANGGHELVVEESGTLQWEWALRPTRDVLGSLEFDLRLPRGPATELRLDLPATATPRLEQNVPMRMVSQDGARRSWHLGLGGHCESVLRIVAAESRQRPDRKPRVRQRTIYDVSLEGLNVESWLLLDVLGEPIRDIAVELDPGVELVRAEYGDQPTVMTINVRGHQRSQRLQGTLQADGRVCKVDNRQERLSAVDAFHSTDDTR